MCDFCRSLCASFTFYSYSLLFIYLQSSLSRCLYFSFSSIFFCLRYFPVFFSHYVPLLPWFFFLAPAFFPHNFFLIYIFIRFFLPTSFAHLYPVFFRFLLLRIFFILFFVLFDLSFIFLYFWFSSEPFPLYFPSIPFAPLQLILLLLHYSFFILISFSDLFFRYFPLLLIHV